MPSNAAKPETIRENAKACLELFSQSILVLVESDGSNVQRGLLDEFGRFKLWTSNIGVFAELQSSLDFRLREFSDIKEPFLRQLTIIESRLHQCELLPTTFPYLPSSADGDSLDSVIKDVLRVQAEDSIDMELDESGSPSSKSEMNSIYQDWDKTQLLESIHQSIDWLHRLSNLVRKANFANQNKRADACKLEDADKNDMTEILTNYYTMLIKREFKDLQDSLVQRLAASMILRRRRIMYRRSQQRRWKLQQIEYTAERLEQPRSLTIVEPPPSHYEKKTLLQSERAITRAETKISTQSRLTATTLDADVRRKFSAPSGISKGSTAPLGKKGKELVPPPPVAAKSGENFICDYCCLILPSNIALNDNSWADHVKKDLDPYVCVVDNCDEPTEIYSSRQEWLAHMRTRHLMRWSCVAKPHLEPVVLEHEEDFIEHMKTEHPGKFRDDQLPLIAGSCSHPKEPAFDDCPFCSGTSENLEEHVGHHLRDLALRSLPWPEDDVQSPQQGTSSEIESSISGEGTRSTTRDFRFQLSELNFEDISQPDVEPGERLRSYEHIPQVLDQYMFLPLPDEVLSTFARYQYPEMDDSSAVNTTKRPDHGAQQSLDDSPHDVKFSDSDVSVKTTNRTGDASPPGGNRLEGFRVALGPQTNPFEYKPSEDHSDDDDNGGWVPTPSELPADAPMVANPPSDAPWEHLRLDQSIFPSEPRSLINVVWDTLDMHVVESKNKLQHMTSIHLVNQIQSASAQSVATAGLDILTAILKGYPPASPMKVLCFVHVIYSFSLVIHGQDAPNRWTDMFIQALCYNVYFSDQDSALYIGIVNALWKPAGMTEEEVDRLIQAKSSASQSSTLKGKEPETHPIYQINNDSLVFVAEYFLDHLEHLIIHVRGDPKTQSIAPYTQHIGEITSEATPNTAYGAIVDYMLKYEFQEFIDYPEFSAALDMLRVQLTPTSRPMTRRIEVELMHIGKISLPSDVYFDSYVLYVRKLTDRLYAQNLPNIIPRLSYYLQDIHFIELIVTGAPILQPGTDDVTWEKPVLLTFPHIADTMTFNHSFELPALDSLDAMTSNYSVETMASSQNVEPVTFNQAVETITSNQSDPSAKTESDFCCEICGYRPKGDPRWFKASMAKHKKLYHGTAPPKIYKCPFPGCDSQYKNRPDNLRQHQIHKNHFVDDQFQISKRKKKA